MVTKLAIFDFDGTLTTSANGGNCWRYIWEEIDATEMDDKLYEDFKAGKFDSHVWAIEVAKEFRLHNVTKKMVERLAANLEIRKGVTETFKFLHSQGVKIFVLSGGIKSMVEFALKDALPYITSIEAEDLKYDSDGVVDGIVLLDHDTDHKCEFILRAMEQYHLTPDQVFFMGNADNDESAAQSGATTLCVNPHKTDPYDKNIWKYYIKDIQNMKEVLPFIK